MKRLALVAAVLLAAVGAALARPAPADAHPLGNFTVNHYAGVELAGSRVYVRFALDLAEIPTLQAGDAVRRAGFAASSDAAARAPHRRHARPARSASSSGDEREARRGRRRFASTPSSPLRSRGGELTFADQSFAEPDRLARDHRHRSGRRAPPVLLGTVGEPLRRAPRVPATSFSHHRSTFARRQCAIRPAPRRAHRPRSGRLPRLPIAEEGSRR